MTRSGLIFDDRYRLDKRIAAGGVGQVWQATDLLLARPVAVKVLRPEYADHPETLERFRSEARLAGALSHPRIAQVHDYGPAGPGGSPYLVLELVDGPSLAEVIDGQPVDPVFALDVVAQAADGLSAAHRAGLVHRDVKPANILIGPEGRVKVTDFGIAHAFGHAPVTTPGLVIGTTQYMAPERISGGPGTPASDLYALGVVLHECLTGKAPYEGAPADVMAAHLYLPLPALPPGTPPELGALVAQLTAKDPARRIGDAHELAGIASRLRDAIDAGQLVTVPAAGTAADLPVLQAAPAAATTALSRSPGATTRYPAPGYVQAVPDARATWADSGPGLAPTRLSDSSGADGDRAGGNGVPSAGPGFARFAALAPGDYPRRRAGVITAGALLVTAAGLAAVLVSGALGPAPTADRTPAGPAGSPSTGARPAPSGSPASSSAAPGGPAGGGAAPSTTRPAPTASAHPRHNGTPVGKQAPPSASPSASTTGPASPTSTPSSSGTPTSPPSSTAPATPTATATPSSPASPSPSPSPTPTATAPCLAGICL